jgi:hypothetical protein
MRWFRTERSFGSGLALFALALQLVLSFGHVHLGELRSGSTVAVVANTKAPDSQPSPAQHPANDTDDCCPICAAIHLTATSFLPQAPQIPLPFASRTIEHFNHFAFTFVAPQRTPFQSRAPPLA